MANGILVFIEHVEGQINRASYEAVRAAQLVGAQLNQEISAVILGHGIGNFAHQLGGIARPQGTVLDTDS